MHGYLRPNRNMIWKIRWKNLQNFAMNRGYQVAVLFRYCQRQYLFEKRKEFFELLDLVIAGKVSTVIITL